MGVSLDIELLRSFVIIAETRALSRAADRVARTQAALSQQMKRLEQCVGQPLLHRTGRGVVLTQQGEQLLIHAHRILRCHDEALAELSDRGLSGTLRFGCPDDYATIFLPALLRGFARRHPLAQVEVDCAPTPRLRERLAQHTVDLALVSWPEGERPEAVIRREPLVWVGHPTTSALDFDVLPLALSHPDTLDHLAACHALRAVARPFRIAYASSSLAGLTALVRSGQAIAVMTQTAVPDDLQILQTGAALPPLPSVGIALEYDHEPPSLLVEAFAQHVQASLPDL
ncbi:LysR family transcriptional regulator [Phytopseudomonas dryadis]|uniref:LysR family transcriptional regulator n=1 Tax=Phytopseudomonas dryadis TaxID=2487520 RepID=A0ABY1Z5A4_9GAMM|nr:MULTISPECIES: LysR family transcriptional regulator [Pseudomonas]TBV03228.1 LysR family transcriptional regulator [Pseudomonas dryadis]TBV16398.1 LysR family transcriptional regulator [Pseudomonas sp. FRB 230]